MDILYKYIFYASAQCYAMNIGGKSLGTKLTDIQWNDNLKIREVEMKCIKFSHHL